MPFFDSHGVRIHYVDHGAGAPVLLVHGFGTDARRHWSDSGLTRALAARYRVIAPDQRGHGRSDKPHTRDHYGMRNLSGDMIRLLDHLAIRRALLAGYSMGSRVCLELLLGHPERFRAAVLGGFGPNGALSVPGQRERIAAALLAHDPDSIADDLPRRFRRSLETGANDLKALAACIAAEESIPDPAELLRIAVPVLFLLGSRDRFVGSPRLMTACFADARVVEIEGGDHLTAPADERFHHAMAHFFAHAPA